MAAARALSWLLLCFAAEGARLVRHGANSTGNLSQAANATQIQPLDVTAISKVTEMLQAISEKSMDLFQKANQDAVASEESCNTEISEKTDELDAVTLQVEDAEASIDELETQIRTFSALVARLGGMIDPMSTQVKDLRVDRANQTQTFSEELADLNFALAAVDRALDVLQAQDSGSLLETRKKGQRKKKGHYTPDGGGIARDEHIFDEFETLPTAQAAYAPVSGNVRDTLTALRQSFADQKAALITREETDHSTFTTQEKILDTRIGAMSKQHASLGKSLATLNVNLENQKVALKEAQENKAAVEAYLSNLETDCAQRKASWEDVIKLRTSELQAVQGVIWIVDTQLTIMDKPSLLRMKKAVVVAASRGPAGPSAEQLSQASQKVMGFLRMEAQTLHSADLGDLAVQLSGLSLDIKGDHDPLAEVKEMITELIERLHQQGLHEASHNAWCDKELGRNEQAQSSANEDIDRENATANRLAGDIQQLGLEIVDLNATIEKNEERKQTLADQRANESYDNEMAIQDADTSETAIAASIMLMEEFFHNLSTDLKSVKAPVIKDADGNAIKTASLPDPGEARSVINVLEVIQQDYRDIIQHTLALEANATKQYEQEMQNLAVSDAAATRDRDNKQAMRATKIGQLAQARDNVNTSSQELADALKAYDALKPPCLEVETYEERKLRRETEIKALEEAYEMLDTLANGGAALVQGKVQISLNDTAVAVLNSSAAANLSQDPGQVSDVASFLKEIRAEVQAELDADTKAHGEMQTWCEDGISQLQTAREESMDRDRELQTAVETSVQAIAQLEVQIQHLTEELETERKSQAQQQELHEKSMEESHDSEVELVESVQKLTAAIRILENRMKANAEPALDASAEAERLEAEKAEIYAGTGLEGGEALITAASDVQFALKSLPASEAAAAFASLQDFLTRPQDLLKSHPALTEMGATVRQADSGQVVGVLKQLLDTMKADLEGVKSKREEDITTNEGLQQTKTAQILALEGSLDNQREQLSLHRTVHADAKTDLAFLRQAMKADYQRLTGVQQTCTQTNLDFIDRNRTRHEELFALDKAVGILEQQAAEEAALGGGGGGGGGGGASPGSFVIHSQPKGRVFTRHLAAPPTKQSASSILDAFLRNHRTGSAAARTLAATPKKTAAREMAQAARSRSQPAATAKIVVEPAGVAAKAAVPAVMRMAAPVAVPVAKVPRAPLAKALAAAMAGGGKQKRLAAVTTRVQLQVRKILEELQLNPVFQDSINEVVREIDVLVTSVEKEGALEVKMKEKCIAEEHQAKEDLEHRLTEEQGFNNSITRINNSIHLLGPEIGQLRDDILAINASVTNLTAQRLEDVATLKENMAREESRLAKLRNALDVLRRHYKKSELRQKSKTVRSALTVGKNASDWMAPVPNASISNWTAPNTSLAPMPKQHESHDLHRGSGGIIGIMEMLVHDSESLIADMLKEETAARDATIKDQNAAEQSINDKERQIIILVQKKGKAEESLQENSNLKASVQTEIKEVHAYLDVVAEKCTALLENFKTNQEHRTAELRSLENAKFALQGMAADGASS